jgi:beta-lactamase class A
MMALVVLGMLVTADGREAATRDSLAVRLAELFGATEGTFAVSVFDLRTGFELGIKEHEQFHAASTMKTPVMIEVFRQAHAGAFRLDDSIQMKNEFRSIVDGSPYSMDISDDSEDLLYGRIGGRATVRELVEAMITVSSNLATNILIELVGAQNVTASMRTLGAEQIQVLRGVEDDKAYAVGKNNTTTARDLMVIYRALAEHRAADSASCDEMLEILARQKFRDVIPALLPDGTKVAHKTGSITGVLHDSGIVFRPDGTAYVVVLLSKELKNAAAGRRTLATASRLIYDALN